MSRPELARNPANRTIVLAMLLMFPVMLAPDPDHLLREGIISMTKKASADEIKAARDRTTPPARDPEVAVAEEYQAARQRGTAQALELFIARHPDSAYAEKARAELRRMSR